MDDAGLEDALFKLSQKAQADFALAEAEREKARELARLVQAQKQHNALLNLQTEQAGVLIDQARQMLDYIRQTALIDDALRDWFGNLSTRLERIERIMILQLSDSGRREKTHLLEEMELAQTEGLIINIKQQIIQYTRNCQKLYEQLANYGTIDAPLALTNQIDQTEARIANLEAQLKELKDG